ncbi:uncharacterized protein LOC125840771 [Solanum verrucosum]|uniref:uncharacterized protein LOC125840771 n=1 Tax=Solanum verrucosum TaxID=315347 RepID=UPI0020D03013|nr:uncharacterized protein LOC125840771 [Solanum verrucosum]
MTTFIKVLCLVLCLALMYEGIESSMCNPGIEISQAKLGMSQGQQVWNATLSNTCTCTLLQVKLSIPNFDSVTKINTTIVSKSHNDIYDVNGGLPIYPQTSVFFIYAGNNLDVTLTDLTEACS